MLFKSANIWLRVCKRIFFLFLLSEKISLTYAEMTVVPANGGTNSGGVIYYAVKYGTTTPIVENKIFVDSKDPSFPFVLFDLNKNQVRESDLSNVLLFDISSTKTDFKVESGNQLVVAVTTNGSSGDKKFLPIASANTNPKSISERTACSTHHCQGTVDIGTSDGIIRFYRSAIFTAGTTLRVGLYIPDICTVYSSGGGTATGCQTPSSGSSPVSIGKQELKLTFIIHTANATDSTSVPASFDGQESTSLLLSFEQSGPSFDGCPTSQTELYFPGDGQIYLDTSGFQASRTSGNAPITTVIVVGNNGAAPYTWDEKFQEKNALSKRVPIGAKDQIISGFTNATATEPNQYTLAFMIRDAAGLVASLSGACTLNEVQTANIQGFLNKGNCFIATAAFGSESARPVQMLRSFRDQVLIKSTLGRYFVHSYYQWSPVLANWLSENPLFRGPVLLALIPVEILAWLFLNPIWLWVFLFSHFILLMTMFITITLAGRGFTKGLLLFCMIFLLLNINTLAEEKSIQPYIDNLKASLPEDQKQKVDQESYTETIKKKLKSKSGDVLELDMRPGENYIDRLRATDPKRFASEKKSSLSYLEEEKAKLAPQSEGGAIQSLQEGRSELKARIEGEIHHAFGFRYGAALKRDITAAPGVQASTFQSVYGGKYAPDFSIFYEYQPFHSEWFGSLGLIGTLGIAFYRGIGAFERELMKPTQMGGGSFVTQSKTKFQFFSTPLMIGLDYRFNFFRVVRPFLMAGPTLVGYMETRNDEKKGFRGYSKAFYTTGGVAVLLNWLSKESSWNYYAEFGIKKYYLTLEYSRLSSFSGDVDFLISGLYLGLAFEY